MGLFSKKPAPKAAPQPELPPTIGPAELDQARALMQRWGMSLDVSDAVWDCLEEAGRLGGYRGDTAMLHEVVEGKDAGVVAQRPWRWWAAASRAAVESGDNELACRIFMFAWLFVNFMHPKFTVGDEMSTGMSKPKDESYHAIARSAIEALGHMPPAGVIVENPAKPPVPLEQVRTGAYGVLGETPPPSRSVEVQPGENPFNSY